MVILMNNNFFFGCKSTVALACVVCGTVLAINLHSGDTEKNWAVTIFSFSCGVWGAQEVMKIGMPKDETEDTKDETEDTKD